MKGSRAAQRLAFMLLRSAQSDLIRQIEYLRVENQVLRARLPERIITTPAERARLLRFGKPLGTTIYKLITIVRPRTFYRWKLEERTGGRRKRRTRGKGGRPPKPPFIRALVLRLARENDWGLTRLTAEIRSLCVGPIGRTTVRSILKAEGVDPGPARSAVIWSEFIERHADTLWACDFLSVRSWTMRGYLSLYLLAFIHVASRRVYISPATRYPDGAWTEQQARNFSMHLDDVGLPCSIMLRDRDAKFTRRFDAILRDHAGGVAMRLPKCSPNMNAYAERFVQTLKHECLDTFIVCGTRHLDYLVGEFVEHYHTERPHQGIGNVSPIQPRAGPAPTGLVRCRSRLGGVLRHYYRAA